MDERATLSNAAKLLKCNNERPETPIRVAVRAARRCACRTPACERVGDGSARMYVCVGSVGASQVIEATGATRVPEHAAALAPSVEEYSLRLMRMPVSRLAPSLLRYRAGWSWRHHTIHFTGQLDVLRSRVDTRWIAQRFLRAGTSSCPSSC